MLKSIELSNFRTFKHLEMSDLPRVCLISGKNSVGKSTVLESILFFYCSHMDTMLNLAQITRSRPLTPHDFLPALFHDYNVGMEAILKFTDETSSHTNTYTCAEEELLPRLPKMTTQNIFNSISEAFRVAAPNMSELTPTSALIINKENVAINQETAPIEKKTTAINYGNFSRSMLAGDVTPPDRNVSFLLAHESSAALPLMSESLFAKLQDAGREMEAIAAIKKIVPMILNIRLSVKDTQPILMCKVDGQPHDIPLNHMGDGVVRAFKMFLYTLIAQADIILIDEVENGIHYSVLNVVWETVFANVKASGCQIFLTTHSYECIEAAVAAYNELHVPAEENLFAFYRLEDRKNDNITAVRYTPEDLVEVIDSNWEIR